MENGEFGDRASTQRAAQLVSAGEPVGTYIDDVGTIWVDATNPAALQKVETIKGEKRTGRPLTAILFAADVVPLLDEEKIPATLHPIFLDPNELAARLGAIAPMRLPVRPAAAAQLPPVLITRTADGITWLQTLLPDGHPTISELVRAFNKAGVNLPGATSMNVSGQPEIVDQEKALAFSHQHGIPYLLRDPHSSHRVEGSFPILGVGPDGVALLREGHFPGRLFRDLLEYEDIDLSHAKPAKYPIPAAIREHFTHHGLPPHELRAELLRAIQGI